MHTPPIRSDQEFSGLPHGFNSGRAHRFTRIKMLQFRQAALNADLNGALFQNRVFTT